MVANISLDLTLQGRWMVYVHIHLPQQLHLYSDFFKVVTLLHIIFIWTVGISLGPADLSEKAENLDIALGRQSQTACDEFHNKNWFGSFLNEDVKLSQSDGNSQRIWSQKGLAIWLYLRVGILAL